MSLRRLDRFVLAKRRERWHELAGQACMVGALFGKQSPYDLIPDEFRPPKPKPHELTPEQRQMQLELGATMLIAAAKANRRRG